jgi:hypothetical protein
MDSTKGSRWVTSVGFTVLSLLPSLAFTAEVTASIRAGASHTDNVFLATSPDQIDDIVYQASPSLGFIHESPQLDARLNYTFDWFRYDDLKTTSKYHRGDASVTGRTWGDSLTVEIGARRGQVLSDPDQVIPPGRLPLSGNLTDRDELWFSPTLIRTFGGAVALNADYRYSEISYEDVLAQQNENQQGTFSLDNYVSGEGLTWALRYNWRLTQYELSAPWEYQQASAELGFWVGTETRIFGVTGKETAWDNFLDPSMVDPFWEAGLSHTLGENLTAEFAAGERSFGPSWRGMLDYTFRRGSTLLSYNESPTTNGFNQPGRPPDIFDPDGVHDFLDRPGGAERYLLKRFDWTLTLELSRTTLDLVVFDEDRSGRLSADGTPLDDQSQTGARASLSWRVGARTTFVTSGSLVKRDTSSTNRSDFVSAGLGIDYNLGVHTDLSLNYSYAEEQPRDALSGSRDYVSNIVSLIFTYTM